MYTLQVRELQADVNPLLWVLETQPASSARTVSTPLFFKGFYLLAFVSYVYSCLCAMTRRSHWVSWNYLRVVLNLWVATHLEPNILFTGVT